jgi:hypothetical protein
MNWTHAPATSWETRCTGKVGYTVWKRYWRRTEDAFYYDLREVARPGTYPDKPKKVPEDQLETE